MLAERLPMIAEQALLVAEVRAISDVSHYY